MKMTKCGPDRDCDPRRWPGFLQRVVRLVASGRRRREATKVNINFAADPDKMKQDAKMVTDKATELTGGVTDDVKADGQSTRHREVK